MNEPAGLDVRRVGGGRRARLAVAAWLAVLVAVAAWVAAAGVASRPRDAGVAALPSATASPSDAKASAPVGPRPTGTVWLRSGSNVRGLDLRSGEVGRPVGTGDWRDRVLRLPDGTFVCVCTDVALVQDGEVVRIVLGTIEGGTLSQPTELATLNGRWDPTRSRNDQAETVMVNAALSPDGRLLLVAVGVRGTKSWDRSLLVVDPASASVVERILMDPLPTGPGVSAWMTAAFSGDGTRVIVSAYGYGLNSLVEDRHFAARVDGALGDLQPIPGFGLVDGQTNGGCADAGPRLLGNDTAFAICHGRNGAHPFLRKVDLDSGRTSDLDLEATLKGVYPMQLVDEASSTLFLWDPFTHLAARVDLASMTLDVSTTIETPTAALAPLERLAWAASAWIAPPALAKIMLEPGLALAEDRLYVVAMSGDGFEDPGEARMVLVLDPADLRLRDTWTVEPDVVSIAIAPNVRDVVIGTLTRGTVSSASEASVAVLDGQSGTVRARYDGLGSEWPLLVDAAAINR